MRPTNDHDGLEDPLSLLTSSHGTLRRFAALTQRLAYHLDKEGNDAESRAAAQAMLRQFDIAAPLHHRDEEEELFPALRALAEPELDRELDALVAEHGELAALWQAVRPWLVDVCRGAANLPPFELADFSLRYPAHAEREEKLAYRAASRLPAGVLKGLSEAMRRRRGAH